MNRPGSNQGRKRSELEKFKRFWNSLSREDQRFLLEVLEAHNSLEADAFVAPHSRNGDEYDRIRVAMAAPAVRLIEAARGRMRFKEQTRSPERAARFAPRQAAKRRRH
jgi:hypothetical protein